ncbi:hypothetical protein GEMRC1_012132 [Eukaryota sp. GEM-RC1]
MLDSLVRVSRRDSWTLYIGVSAEAVYLPQKNVNAKAITPLTTEVINGYLPQHIQTPKGTPIPTTEAVYCGGQPLILLVISGTFNSLFRVLFTFPSRYL